MADILKSTLENNLRPKANIEVQHYGNAFAETISSGKNCLIASFGTSALDIKALPSYEAIAKQTELQRTRITQGQIRDLMFAVEKQLGPEPKMSVAMLGKREVGPDIPSLFSASVGQSQIFLLDNQTNTLKQVRNGQNPDFASLEKGSRIALFISDIQKRNKVLITCGLSNAEPKLLSKVQTSYNNAVDSNSGIVDLEKMSLSLTEATKISDIGIAMMTLNEV